MVITNSGMLNEALLSFFRKPREPIRMPKVDLKAKFAAMNEKVKKARMPSPHELRDGYLNSSFHKSFQQPLAVRSREMDDPEELEQRQVQYLLKLPLFADQLLATVKMHNLLVRQVQSFFEIVIPCASEI